jgi:hypothetical protein
LPFFTILGFLPSPKKPFVLLVYVEVVARSLVVGHSRGFVSRISLVDPKVHELLGTEAIEPDKDCNTSTQFVIGSSSSADNSDVSM